jgi:hypothetical protein
MYKPDNPEIFQLELVREGCACVCLFLMNSPARGCVHTGTGMRALPLWTVPVVCHLLACLLPFSVEPAHLATGSTSTWHPRLISVSVIGYSHSSAEASESIDARRPSQHQQLTDARGKNGAGISDTIGRNRYSAARL